MLCRASEEGMVEVLGERGGYGSGFGEDVLRDADGSGQQETRHVSVVKYGNITNSYANTRKGWQHFH